MRSLAKLLGSTIFAQMLIMAVSPILTRLYSPEIFGTFSLLVSWVYIANSVALARMDVAILATKTEDEIKIPFSMGVFFAFSISCIASILIYFLYFFKIIDTFYFLIPFMVFSLALYQLILSLFLRKGCINFVANNKVRQSAMLCGGQIFLGVVYPSVLALALAQLLSFLVTITLVFNFWKNYIFKINPIEKVKDFKNFIVFDTFSNLLQVVSNNLPAIVITYLLGEYIGGLFYMSYRVLITPVSIFSVSISQMISSDFVKYIDLKKIWLERNNLFIIAIMLLFTIPFMLVGAYIEALFPIVFGKSWIEAGLIIKYFLCWIYLRLIYDAFIINLSLFGKSKIKMILDFFVFIVIVSTMAVLWLRGFHGIDFIEYLAYSNALTLLLAFFVLNFYAGFKAILNFVVACLCCIFIYFYAYIENIYISMLLFLALLPMSLILYSKYKKIYKVD